MSPKLKPLLLPQLVEERRKRESLSDSEADLLSSSFRTQNSSASDIPSPVTPTFSPRGHFRYSSSSSSIDSTYHTSTVESPSSPTFIAKSGKRSLPDVQEEPHEREAELDVTNYENDLYNCWCDSEQCLHRESTMAQSSVQLSTKTEFDYDLADGFFSDGEFSTSPRTKKRRGNESALNGLATRFGTRFPSFSRKFKLRRGASSTSLKSDALRDSNTISSRSSSISNSARPGLDTAFEAQMPSTPTRSSYGRDEVVMPIDIERANRDSGDREEAFATTPLLPPLMMDASANIKPVNLQSPLQSPSVADAKDSFSGNVTPIDAITTPYLSGTSSPSLSTKPSVASFHHHQRPGHLTPLADIPPLMPLSSTELPPSDKWAIKLGHANFTIHPEPYLPTTFDISNCRSLRADWDVARCNYTRHLVRTGEHYGVTSQTYKLTEEKWAATEKVWKKNNDITIANTAESGHDAFATLQHTVFGEQRSNVMTKIPSLSNARSEGKFPQLGDEDIVGPMVQVAAAAGLKRTPSKKSKLFKFIVDKFPSSLVGSTGRT